MNIYDKFLTVALILSGLTDAVRKVGAGGISGLGMITIIFGFGTWILVFSRSRMPNAVLSASSLVFFLIVIIISWLLHFDSLAPITVIQNVSVYLGFVGFILLSTIQTYHSFELPEYISKYLPRSIQISVTLYGLGLLLDGPGSRMIMGARSFALFAIIGVAWFLASWRYRIPKSLFWTSFAILTLAFSFSRTALVIALLLFPLSQISFTSIKGLMRMSFIIFLIVTVSYLAFTYVEPIRSRFTDQGDNASVGGVQVNTSGRSTAWPVAYASAMESPWIGKGPTSVGIVLVKRVSVHFLHPHNDYLRFFHDCGLIGLVFWMLGYFGLIGKSWQNWQWADKYDQENAHIHLASFLALIAAALGMISDNVVVYPFVMFPLGTLVGASVGSGSKRKKELKLARKSALMPSSIQVNNYQT
ncbi:O-antigen ligase family protein [Cylindrospermum sp. FACHB-282]|uniref:O-antigen ligase family protein n=1 Tax=Cylindrospermum sp. FACHB-282 TaxID=2692794 RepID=UPI0016848341|nr:O-antigen ligase family protein [Cylindrospermum sp. FACHB-282]MBD2388122.1 O-antigen ligase family protein [Cylindrospermum sp. FACHB-282]